MDTDIKLSSQTNKELITTSIKDTEVTSTLGTLLLRSPLSVDNIQLIGAQDAGTILGVNRRTIYALWNDGSLAYWNINGTKRTNLLAIADYLLKTQSNEPLAERREH